jgi:hypothetical protein
MEAGNRIGSAGSHFSADTHFMTHASIPPLGGTKSPARAFIVADHLNTSGL